MLKVSFSISIKSIFAPQYKAQFAEATKLIDEVQTWSFCFKPKALHAM